MASDDAADTTTDGKIRRRVGRTIANWTTVLISLGVIGAWAATGYYQLLPGEAAVILRFGAFSRTVKTSGPHLRWPTPLEHHQKVNLDEKLQENFGLGSHDQAGPGEESASFDNAMQTGDNNIVNLSYSVQYHIGDGDSFLYGMAEAKATLRDAAQAAVREVVGSKTIDDVLTGGKRSIQLEAKEVLEDLLAGYFGGDRQRSPFRIDEVQIQLAQPPPPVQDAFNDVTRARQDQDRQVAEAAGDVKVIRARAGARAAELRQAADAYRLARVADATGESQRFVDLVVEYQRAREVTRQRLYLETMEQILPDAQKLIVDPDTVKLMPFFPTSNGTGRAAVAAAVAAAGTLPAATAPAPARPIDGGGGGAR